MRTLFRLGAAFAVAAALAAAPAVGPAVAQKNQPSGAYKAKPDAPQEIRGTWRLVAVDGSVAPEPVQKSTKFVFHKNGDLTGEAACNTFKGRFKTHGKDFEIYKIISSRRSCGRQDKIENDIFNAMGSVNRARYGQNETLVLMTGDRPRLRLRRF